MRHSTSSHNAGIIEEEVNGFPVEFRGRRLDTRELSDIQGQDPQFVAALVSQSAQLGSGIWITTSRVNLPAVGQVLSGKLDPESAIGTGDQGAWHRFLHCWPLFTAIFGPPAHFSSGFVLSPYSSLVRRHALPSEFLDRVLVL